MLQIRKLCFAWTPLLYTFFYILGWFFKVKCHIFLRIALWRYSWASLYCQNWFGAVSCSSTLYSYILDIQARSCVMARIYLLTCLNFLQSAAIMWLHYYEKWGVNTYLFQLYALKKLEKISQSISWLYIQRFFSDNSCIFNMFVYPLPTIC